MSERTYAKSHELLARAEQTIPLGAQTFSKSKLAYPKQAPLFVTHGKGGHVWDVDGNEYVDMVSGLLPNILGYCDPDVDGAIRRQLDRGISFSLSTELEVELAERLNKHVPCAEMSRFGKTGTDVTSAAVRLARAAMHRGSIIKFKGHYHGWADWAVWDTERGRGTIPGGNSSHSADNLEQLDEWLDRSVAAVIVEASQPKEWLEAVRDKAHANGSLFIMDEVITGFRWHIGGAQKYHGITPDLACFGKAMGNGMPISALCGKREIMQLLDRVHFSGTFFGETLSLAAAIATIDKIERENVCERLWHLTGRLGMDAPWQPLKFPDDGAKALFIERMCAQGVLTSGSYNVCFAHTDADIEKVRHVEGPIFRAIAHGERAEAVRPIFNARAA